jgi:hypothetical protein
MDELLIAFKQVGFECTAVEVRQIFAEHLADKSNYLQMDRFFQTVASHPLCKHWQVYNDETPKGIHKLTLLKNEIDGLGGSVLSDLKESKFMTKALEVYEITHSPVSKPARTIRPVSAKPMPIRGPRKDAKTYLKEAKAKMAEERKAMLEMSNKSKDLKERECVRLIGQANAMLKKDESALKYVTHIEKKSGTLKVLLIQSDGKTEEPVKEL